MARVQALTPTEYNGAPGRRRLIARIPAALVVRYPDLAADPKSRKFAAAVSRFQEDTPGVVADGKLGPKTIRAMEAAASGGRARVVGMRSSRPEILFPEEAPRVWTPEEVFLWLGWFKGTKTQYKELADAGVTHWAINFNDATKPGFEFNPSEKLLRTQLKRVAEVGGKVVIMPWMWWYPEFLKTLVRHLRRYEREYPGLIVERELNAEGSSRASAAHIARRRGISPAEVVNEGMKILAGDWPDDINGACSILHLHQEHNEALARHPLIRRLVVEAYSISKFRQPYLQPGEFQHHGYEVWDELLWDRDVDMIDVGIPNWDQAARARPNYPAHLRQTTWEAAREASDACLELKARPHVWAGHLMDGNAKSKAAKAAERENYARTLTEIRYMARGEGRFEIYDENRWHEDGYAIPEGFTRFRDLGRPVPFEVGRLATLVGWRKNPLGTRTPITFEGERFIALDAPHTKIGATGEELPPGRFVHGVNVYPETPTAEETQAPFEAPAGSPCDEG